MQVTEATFEAPSDAEWALRVKVRGSEFLHRAAPVVAVVGDVLVESIIVNAASDEFVGLLRIFPPVGAELRVGYADSRLLETGITFDPPVG